MLMYYWTEPIVIRIHTAVLDHVNCYPWSQNSSEKLYSDEIMVEFDFKMIDYNL